VGIDNEVLELNLKPKDSEEEVPGYMERLIYLLTEYSPPKLAVAKYFNSYPFFLKANHQESQGFSVYGSEDEAPCFPKGKESDKSSPKQPQPGLSLDDLDDEAPCFPRSKESETTPYALSINVMKSMLGRGSAEVFEKTDNTPKDAESTDVLKAKLLDEVTTNTKAEPSLLAPVIKNEPFPFGEGIVTDGLNELNDHYLGANSKNDKEEIEELKFEDRLVEDGVRFTPSPRREPALFVVFAAHPSIDQSRPNDGVQAVLDTIVTASVLEELSQNARNNPQYLEGIVKDEPFPFGFELVDGAVGHLQEGYNENARARSTRWSHNEQQRASMYRNHRRRMAAVEAQMLPRSLRNRRKEKEASQNQLSEMPKEEAPVKTEEELAREAKEREAHEAAQVLRRQLKKQRQKERRELAKQEQAREKMLLDEEKAKKDAERLAKREAAASAETDAKREKEEREALAKANKDQEELDKKAKEEKQKASPKNFTPFKASLNPPSESESPVINAPEEPKEVPKTLVLRPIRPAVPVAKSFAQKPKANIPVRVGKKVSSSRTLFIKTVANWCHRNP
jgi:chemotaxis protein histidine kinase CheA